MSVLSQGRVGPGAPIGRVATLSIDKQTSENFLISLLISLIIDKQISENVGFLNFLIDKQTSENAGFFSTSEFLNELTSQRL